MDGSPEIKRVAVYTSHAGASVVPIEAALAIFDHVATSA
jgi:hypothetical protein